MATETTAAPFICQDGVARMLAPPHLRLFSLQRDGHWLADTFDPGLRSAQDFKKGGRALYALGYGRLSLPG